LFKSAYLSFPVELQWALRSCVLFHLTWRKIALFNKYIFHLLLNRRNCGCH
jgi:hypothetical protein